MEWNSNTECCIEGTLKTEDGDEMREVKTGRCGQGKKKKETKRDDGNDQKTPGNSCSA